MTDRVRDLRAAVWRLSEAAARGATWERPRPGEDFVWSGPVFRPATRISDLPEFARVVELLSHGSFMAFRPGQILVGAGFNGRSWAARYEPTALLGAFLGLLFNEQCSGGLEREGFELLFERLRRFVQSMEYPTSLVGIPGRQCMSQAHTPITFGSGIEFRRLTALEAHRWNRLHLGGMDDKLAVSNAGAPRVVESQWAFVATDWASFVSDASAKTPTEVSGPPRHPSIHDELIFRLSRIAGLVRVLETKDLGLAGAGFLDWNIGTPIELVAFERLGPVHAPGPLDVGQSTLERTAGCLQALSEAGHSFRSLAIALERFESAHRRSLSMDRFLDLVICAEALLLGSMFHGQGGDKSMRLRLNGAHFARPDRISRSDAFDFYGDVYGRRSEYVHGSPVKWGSSSHGHASSMACALSDYLRVGLLNALAVLEEAPQSSAPFDWRASLLGDSDPG